MDQMAAGGSVGRAGAQGGRGCRSGCALEKEEGLPERQAVLPALPVRGLAGPACLGGREFLKIERLTEDVEIRREVRTCGERNSSHPALYGYNLSVSLVLFSWLRVHI